MSAFDRRIGVYGATAYKVPVRVATTGPITLSDLQSVDGVSLSSGDRVLVRAQANAVQNGIWTVDTGEWSRAKDFNGILDAVQGTQLAVNEGTYGLTTWSLVSENPVIGATPLIFALFGDGLSDQVSLRDFKWATDTDYTAALGRALDAMMLKPFTLIIPAAVNTIASPVSRVGNETHIFDIIGERGSELNWTSTTAGILLSLSGSTIVGRLATKFPYQTTTTGWHLEDTTPSAKLTSDVKAGSYGPYPVDDLRDIYDGAVINLKAQRLHIGCETRQYICKGQQFKVRPGSIVYNTPGSPTDFTGSIHTEEPSEHGWRASGQLYNGLATAVDASGFWVQLDQASNPPATAGPVLGCRIIVDGDYSKARYIHDYDPGTATQAKGTVNPAGTDNSLIYTAVTGGTTGNSITVRYVDPGSNSAVLSASVVGSAITVSLGTDSGGTITSKAVNVARAIQNSAPASALVTVTIDPADATTAYGEGLVTAMSAVTLTGGAARVSRAYLDAANADPIPAFNPIPTTSSNIIIDCPTYVFVYRAPKVRIRGVKFSGALLKEGNRTGITMENVDSPELIDVEYGPGFPRVGSDIHDSYRPTWRNTLGKDNNLDSEGHVDRAWGCSYVTYDGGYSVNAGSPFDIAGKQTCGPGVMRRCIVDGGEKSFHTGTGQDATLYSSSNPNAGASGHGAAFRFLYEDIEIRRVVEPLLIRGSECTYHRFLVRGAFWRGILFTEGSDAFLDGFHFAQDVSAAIYPPTDGPLSSAGAPAYIDWRNWKGAITMRNFTGDIILGTDQLVMCHPARPHVWLDNSDLRNLYDGDLLIEGWKLNVYAPADFRLFGTETVAWATVGWRVLIKPGDITAKGVGQYLGLAAPMDTSWAMVTGTGALDYWNQIGDNEFIVCMSRNNAMKIPLALGGNYLHLTVFAMYRNAMPIFNGIWNVNDLLNFSDMGGTTTSTAKALNPPLTGVSSDMGCIALAHDTKNVWIENRTAFANTFLIKRAAGV